MTTYPIAFNDRFSLASPALGETLLTFDFLYLEDAELAVDRLDAGVRTPLLPGIDYTLTGKGNNAGGTVTLLIAANGTSTYEIYGITQEDIKAAFSVSNPVNAASLNAMLARVSMFTQEHRRDLDKLLASPIVQKADFSARLMLPQNVPANAWVTVENDQERHDKGSDYDKTTYKFTAPRSATYLFGAKAVYLKDITAPASMFTGFSVNGADPIFGQFARSTGVDFVDFQTTAELVVPISLSAGDTVTQVVEFTVAPVIISHLTSYFWGVEI